MALGKLLHDGVIADSGSPVSRAGSPRYRIRPAIGQARSERALQLVDFFMHVLYIPRKGTEPAQVLGGIMKLLYCCAAAAALLGCAPLPEEPAHAVELAEACVAQPSWQLPS